MTLEKISLKAYASLRRTYEKNIVIGTYVAFYYRIVWFRKTFERTIGRPAKHVRRKNLRHAKWGLLRVQSKNKPIKWTVRTFWRCPKSGVVWRNAPTTTATTTANVDATAATTTHAATATTTSATDAATTTTTTTTNVDATTTSAANTSATAAATTL